MARFSPPRFCPPTSLMEFFQKSEGTWFVQRTVHHFDCRDDESGESNLSVIALEAGADRVAEICQQQGIDPQLAAGGARFYWQQNLSDKPENEKYAAVLVDLPEPGSGGQRGRIIRDQGYVESMPVISRYWIGPDGLLTIDTDYENNQGQERVWFLDANVRVRVSSVRMAGGVNLTTHCSEFRCVSEAELDAMVAAHQGSS